MKLRTTRSKFVALLPCLGVVALGALTAIADPPERVGADAPHQERNQAKNERNTALPLSEVTVPQATQKPVRKATAVKAETTARKSKDKKKGEQQAKEKQKTEAAAAANTVQDRSQYYDPDTDDRVGSGAPHQERGSSDRRGARLFILER